MVDYDIKTIHLYTTGFKSVSPIGRAVASKNISSYKRGQIKGFSYASKRRLKSFLLNNISFGSCYGITCTVPFMEFNQDIWLLLLKRFFMRVTRLNLPLVYRVELQANGMPHLHCVSYFNSVDDCFNIQLSWWESLSSIQYESDEYGTISLLQRDGALLYSCLLSAPSGNFSQWYRYLASHASKSKQAQLGYKGKHWGICNRKLFFESQCLSTYQLDSHQFYIFLRWLRKLCKCKTGRFLRGSTVQFCDNKTISRMIDYILENTALPF